jgi:hypothetical protein
MKAHHQVLDNLRARKVGINQILNTYMPPLQNDANQLAALYRLTTKFISQSLF